MIPNSSYYLNKLFLDEIHHRRQMIAVAVHPSAPRLCTQRITFISAIRLYQEIALENLVTVITQFLMAFVQEITRKYNLIEQIPFASVF